MKGKGGSKMNKERKEEYEDDDDDDAPFEYVMGERREVSSLSLLLSVSLSIIFLYIYISLHISHVKHCYQDYQFCWK